MKLNLKIVAATAAVAMMSSGAAYAQATVDIVGGPYTLSSEGLSLSGTAAVELPDITVVFGNNLTYQDDILITLPNTVSLPATPSVDLVTCSIGGTAVGYVGTLANGWKFRVTSVDGVNLGDTCTFSGLEVQAATLANNNGQICYRADRFGTGEKVDGTVCNDEEDFVVESQFGISVQTALNGEIDVYADRKTFSAAEGVAPGSAAGDPLRADTLRFTTTVTGSQALLSDYYGPTVTVVAGGQKVTINGGFEWTADPDCFDSGLVGFAGWAPTAASTCGSLILTGVDAGQLNEGYFYVPGDVILNPTDWTGQVEWTYRLTSCGGSCATNKLGQNWDPGIWTINGAQVYIQYMPWGEGISRIVYAANTGAINADVSADVFYNGMQYFCDLGQAGPSSVTNLSAALNACAEANGIETGKVAILLTFTAPDKDIEVYSAYNVGGSDRGTVVNTSNGRAFFYGTGVNGLPPMLP